MVSDSEVRQDLGYGPNMYPLRSTREKNLHSLMTSVETGSGVSPTSRTGLVRIRLIRGINQGHVYQMAERFTEDLIRRGFAERV